MALKSVNYFPASSSGPVPPTGPVIDNVRSSTSTVSGSSLQALLGYTGIVKSDTLPAADTQLIEKTIDVSLSSVERRVPEVGQASVVMSGGDMVITKSSNSPSEKCIYEIQSSVGGEASVLGYWKIKTDYIWQTQSPDWLSSTDIVCPYFGIELGQRNTGVFVFLKKSGSMGSMVIGGPSQGLSTVRPNQQELPVNWAIASPMSMELWVYINTQGYSTSFIPTVEIWTRFSIGGALSKVFSGYLSDFGTFLPESTAFFNARKGITDTCTLFIGNAGKSGDILRVSDWALFPDFRKAVEHGRPSPNHELTLLPDSPSGYDTAEGLSPRECSPRRWSVLQGGVNPEEHLESPGWSLRPTHLSIPKTSPQPSGFEREEPRLSARQDGFMVEASMSSELTAMLEQEVLGSGFGVDDGEYKYQIVAVEYPRRTLGIPKASVAPELSSSCYLLDQDLDLRTRKLVRLTVDRHRSKMSVDVEEKRVLDIPMPTDLPLSTSPGKVYFGHLLTVPEKLNFRIQSLKYLQRYKAWEAEDGDLPPDSDISATDAPAFSLTSSGAGSVSPISSGVMKMSKSGTESGSLLYYKKEEPFSYEDGAFLELTCSLDWYKGSTGISLPSNTWSGVGARIHFGDSSLTLGFFNCGPYGRVVGVIPSQGINEIINQTQTGRKYSCPHDWMEETTYRVVYSPYKDIKIYTKTTALPPSIVIPWDSSSQSFNLPADGSPTGISFGHYLEDYTSLSSWKSVRWSPGNGKDLSVKQKFPEGTRPYHFGGKVLSMIGFDE